MKCLAGIAFLAVLLALALTLYGCGASGSRTAAAMPAAASRKSSGPNIGHVVVIMMENRSFDSYFGTFPGVNGIPQNPNCNPDPETQQCILPYHDTSLINYGGPHSPGDMWVDLDGGKLDGFIVSAEHQPRYIDPYPDEVMGYHTCAEIPVYCKYARDYTLADNHFAATSSWSTMAHLYMVSGWSAKCTTPGDPMSCTSSNDVDPLTTDYAWTDITWLLHARKVSWGYYVYGKNSHLAPNEDGEAPTGDWSYNSVGPWNPLPNFDDVKIDNETKNLQPGGNFLAQAKAGTLPAVSWVIPPFPSSDHPAMPISKGQAWVKRQVEAVMNGPNWSTTLIILSWDEWGGFYDHVIPPVIDGGGFGFRTPLILIGPMVKRGHVDHQLLSSDAYLKLVEDTFLGSQRLDANDGRPDSRPDVRENVPGLGDLRNDLQ